MDTLLKIYTKYRAFKESESGATAIEYGLIAGLISIVIVTAAGGIGTQLGTKFTAIQTALTP